MYAYPGIFAAAGLSRMCVSVMGLLGTWSQAIRDKEFLVEMKLQNHESNKPKKNDQGSLATHDETASATTTATTIEGQRA